MTLRIPARQMGEIVSHLLVLIACPGLIFNRNAFPRLAITMDVNQDVEPPLRALNMVRGYSPPDGHDIASLIACLTLNQVEERAKKGIPLAVGAMGV